MAVDNVRKAITNMAPVSTTTVHGWPAVIVGLPFIGIGAFIILLALNVIPSPDSNFHVPRGMVAAFGGMFFVAGASVLIHGLISIKHASRRKQLLSQHPGQTWLADYRWDHKGISDDTFKKVANAFWGSLGIIVFLIPFHWLIFSIKDMPGILKAFILLFDSFLVACLGYAVYLLLRFLKYGTSYLQFTQFPFFLGEELQATLTSRAIKGLKDMTVTLRCIEEKYEVRGTGKNRSVQVVSYQIYADTLTIENAGGGQYNRVYLPVAFLLPADKNFVTALSARPAKYWQMEFKASTPGIDYSTSFLIPVYGRNL